MSEEYTPTARWVQQEDGSWEPVRSTAAPASTEDASTADFLSPDEIKAGPNITVTDNGDGTVTIGSSGGGSGGPQIDVVLLQPDPPDMTLPKYAGLNVLWVDSNATPGTGGALPPPGRLPKVFYQNNRPGTTVGVDAVETDYWIRPPTGTTDIAPADATTNAGRWVVMGFGYPAGANISQGQDGISLVWTTGGPNGQQAGIAIPFQDERVYLAEVAVEPLSGAATRARLVWGFTQDGGVITLTPGQESVLRMFIPWHTGMNNFLIVQGDDTANGGGVLVKSVKVLDVTDGRGEQYVLDDVMGWVLVGDGKGGGVGGGSPIGSIMAWAGTAPPDGWQLCDGSAPASPALAALVGATVPDLRGKFILGESATHAHGSTGGAETVTLTPAQMPSHTHTVRVNTFPPGAPINGTVAVGSGQPTTGQGEAIQTSADNSGGGQAHENMPPYYALAWIIKHTGVAANGLTKAESDLLYAPKNTVAVTDFDTMTANGVFSAIIDAAHNPLGITAHDWRMWVCEVTCLNADWVTQRAWLIGSSAGDESSPGVWFERRYDGGAKTWTAWVRAGGVLGGEVDVTFDAASGWATVPGVPAGYVLVAVTAVDVGAPIAFMFASWGGNAVFGGGAGTTRKIRWMAAKV